MPEDVSPLAGQPAEPSMLIKVPRLLTAYFTGQPDPTVPSQRAAEITVQTKRDPSEAYVGLTRELGVPFYERIDAPATAEQKELLKTLAPDQIGMTELAGEPIRAKLTAAPGSSLPLGGIKVVAENGWFAARPSGTEDVYKIYAESFRSADHLHHIQQEAQEAIGRLFMSAKPA